MKNQQLFRGKRLEEVVRGYPGIYKVWVWDELKGKYIDPKEILHNLQKPYRVRKRVVALGKTIRVSKYFNALDEARKWKESQEASVEMEGQGSLNLKSSTYTLQNLVEEWRKYTRPPRLKDSTWQTYAKDIEHLKPLHNVEVDQLSANDIDQWLRILTDPSYPKTRARRSFVREVKVLGVVLRWYKEYKNPSYSVPILKRHRKDACYQEKTLKEHKALTAIELEQFLQKLQDRQSPIYYYLASFQALTGVRIGEACGLQWDCVDLIEGWVTIRRIVWWEYRNKKPNLREGTKTDKLRRIRLCDRLIELVKEWKIKCGAISPMVFHRKGELMRYPAIQNAYNQAFEKLGLPFRSTHILRHTFATLFVSQTQNREALRSLLGHQTFAMTEKYAHTTEQTQEEAMKDFRLGKKLYVIQGSKKE